MKALVRTVGQITKGKHKGALVSPCTDSMDSPFYRGANDEAVTICHITSNGEIGLIIALKETELRWLY